MSTDRIFNFSAGPAVLPEEVLKEAQRDIWNIDGSGVGIMEHSHRGPVFDRIMAEAEADCRDIAGIPDNYKILFVQGGASSQFFMVPANFLSNGRTADYINTGVWSTKAIKEAKLYGRVNVAGSSEDKNFSYIPRQGQLRFTEGGSGENGAAYLHFTSNNTIYGTQYSDEPIPNDGVPLICDASSDIFSKPIDVSKYGLIYAGAQKNLGPSGVVLVIAREDLIARGATNLPAMLQYRTHAENDSRYNTPPAFGIYIMGRVFKWIKAQGGLARIADRNEKKAATIYNAIDGSSFYKANVAEESRSKMNVCFTTPSEDLDKLFVKEAAKAGMDGLKGHRSAGGMRASIYNAFPQAGCEALAQFMAEFERKNG
jgi:phosphoserine aminotransferase